MKPILDHLKHFNDLRKMMPNGGAILSTHNGKLNDGLSILCEFESQRKADRTLKAAGFKRLPDGNWK